MRSSSILVAAFAVFSTVSAMHLNTFVPRDYPACANTCLANANFDGCNSADFNCLCKDHVFLDTTTQCIYNECTDPADLKQAIDTAQEACAAAGITLTSTYTPTQSRTATSSGSGSTGSATSSGTLTSTPSTNTASSSTTAAPTTTSSGAAMRGVSSNGALAVIGAAVLGALAF